MSLDAAARAVSAIVATGIVPAALEMIDQATIRAVEASIYAAGYPTDAAAALLIELDGAAAGLERRRRDGRGALHDATARAPCASRATRPSARGSGRDARKRSARWAACRRTSSCRTPSCRARKLPEVLAEIHRIGEATSRAGVQRLSRRRRQPASRTSRTTPPTPTRSARVHAAMREIMTACVDAGGTITGEHGVGLDKLPYMDMIFSPTRWPTMCASARRVRSGAAFESRARSFRCTRCREWHMAPAARASGPRMTTRRRRSPSTDDCASACATRRSAARRCESSARGTWLDAGRPVRATETAARRASCRDHRVRAGRSHAHRARRHDARRNPRRDGARTVSGSRSIRPAPTTARSARRSRRRRPVRSLTSFGAPRDLALGVEFVTGAGASRAAAGAS